MFSITCESTIDLPLSYIKQRNVNVIHYSYFVKDVEYVDSMDNSKEYFDEFYSRIDKDKPTTSQINQDKYTEFFLKELEHGDVLHISFGSGMSASVFNAQKAAEKLNAENKNQVYVVDSTCSCVGYGMLVDYALDMRDKGFSLDEIVTFLEKRKHGLHHDFFTTTLTYFGKSGRVSNIAAFIGNLLRLCPLMRLNYDGKIVVCGKVMSVTKSMEQTIKTVTSHIDNGLDYDGKLWISHSNCLATAQKTYESLKKLFPNADIRIFDIGPIIACHCGPGTMAVYYLGDDRPQ